MEREPFFKTNLEELSNNRDNCIDKLIYYVSKKVIQECSNVQTMEDNNNLIDSPQKSFSEYIRKVNLIIQTRCVILREINSGISPKYLRNLIDDDNRDNRDVFRHLIWNKIPNLNLLYYNL